MPRSMSRATMGSTCTPIPKLGKAKRRKVDPAHRAATLIASASDCLLCERLGCVPAHWPRHRGLGGGHAGWDLREWVPLCGQCHDIAAVSYTHLRAHETDSYLV